MSCISYENAEPQNHSAREGMKKTVRAFKFDDESAEDTCLFPKPAVRKYMKKSEDSAIKEAEFLITLRTIIAQHFPEWACYIPEVESYDKSYIKMEKASGKTLKELSPDLDNYEFAKIMLKVMNF